LEKEDSLLLRPEGEAEVIRVPLQRALQRAGLSVHKLRQLREQKIRLDVELDANGEVRTLLKRK
jgi:hypothetical protein